MKVNQIKAGVILSYLLTATNAVVGFIYIPILVYFLGQDEYGLYQLLGSFLVYLGLFDFGLSNTVTRYYSKYIALRDKKGQENLLAISTVLYLILAILLVIVGLFLYNYLDDFFRNSLTYSEIIKAKKMYIVILVTVTITISCSIFNAVINANERFVFLRILSIVQTIMRPIIVLMVFTFEASALNVVLVQALINIIGVVLRIYYSFVKLQVKIKLHYFDSSLIKEMFRYSFFIFITAVVDQIFWRSDQLILGAIIGTTSVAVYSIGSQIVTYYMTLSTSMSGVFLPNITKRVTENASNKELTDVFIKVGRLQYILLGLVLSGFVLFGKEFINIWVGSSFVDAYYIVLLIILPFTIDLIQNIGLTILQAKNMYAFRAILFVGMSLFNIGISIPLAIKYGGIGTAVATGFTYLIGTGLIMNVYYYKKVGLNVFRFWKQIIRLSLSIIIIFIAGIVINKLTFESQTITLIVKILLFTLCYSIIIWKTGMNKFEKDLIVGIVKKLTIGIIKK